MEPIKQVEGRAIPFGRKNVDTDVIIPAKWLKTITREGLGRGAFETLRQDPDNLFDSPQFKGAPILIAGDNFGCGSSNAFKNGILAVVLPQEQIDRLMVVAQDQPIAIDLENQTVTTPYQDRFQFEIDPFRKHCLLHGLDEVGLTMARDAAISTYEQKHRAELPWLAAGTGAAA